MLVLAMEFSRGNPGPAGTGERPGSVASGVASERGWQPNEATCHHSFKTEQRGPTSVPFPAGSLSGPRCRSVRRAPSNQ
jgi:hypothetical protein